MKRMGTGWILVAALMLGLTTSLLAGPAQAGCGCDHPAPAWAPVMPAFAFPGGKIRLDGDGVSFKVGRTYTVEFLRPLVPLKVTVTAQSTRSIDVVLPAGIMAGPIAIHVTGKNLDKTYGKELFTALPLPRQLPAGDVLVAINDYLGAVAQDGTLLIPFDLTQIADPEQFALALTNLPLRFGADDVIFYNKHGVDLTLFTMDVADPTERQWGSYYGWDVETDAGMVNTVYDHQVAKSLQSGSESDVLTYWRHEFHTYNTAHMAGGSHVVDANGFHPDGTFHIDHDYLILAIDTAGQLAPGRKLFDLLVTTAVTETPIEPAEMAARLDASQAYVERSGAFTDLVTMFSGIGATDQTSSKKSDATTPSYDSVKLTAQ